MDYDDEIKQATKKALLAGGLTGGVLGTGSALINGVKGKALGSAALRSIIGGAGLAGGSTYLGSKLFGAPNENDPTGFTTRAGVGGAIGGGGIGAVLGGIAGGTEKGAAALVPKALMPYARELHMLKGGKGAAIGAALGALGLGGLAAYKGADEGMALDFMRNKANEDHRQRMREKYGV